MKIPPRACATPQAPPVILKGVLYSHRSTILHAFALSMPDALSLSASDTITPIVPMFHVNAWGLPYAALMVGAKLVLPGPKLDGASLHTLFENEGVTMTAGVPTVWLGLLDWMQANNKTFSTLQRLVIGGSSAPPVMISRFHKLGVKVRHAWGMTKPARLAWLPPCCPNTNPCPRTRSSNCWPSRDARCLGWSFVSMVTMANLLPAMARCLEP